jgi:hypothetical protein
MQDFKAGMKLREERQDTTRTITPSDLQTRIPIPY